MSNFRGIIDIYDENSFNPTRVWDDGTVKVILHQATRGCYKKDTKYLDRKAKAMAKGFLWAGYHLLSAEPVADQVDYFLSMENGSDPRVGMAIDWEPSRKGMMSYERLRDFVTLFVQRTGGRYPILYGGSIIRETDGILNGDPLLSRCPLWYVRYTHGALGIPANTWTNYTLWQFDDENKEWGAPTVPGVSGEDWNEYPGTWEDLQAAWPFSAATFVPDIIINPTDPTTVPAASLAFDMKLEHSSDLLQGTLTVLDAKGKKLAAFPATSGLPLHQSKDDLWVSGQGPVPDLSGLTVQTGLRELDTDGYNGPSFPLLPRKLAAPAGRVSRGDFELHGVNSFAGTHGGISVLAGEDFKKLVDHVTAAKGAGVDSLPLKITYQSAAGPGTVPAAATASGAAFTMDLHESDELILGLFVVRNAAGDEIFSAEATSGLSGWQKEEDLWTPNHGPVPPNPNAAQGHTIQTDEYFSSYIGGYAFYITPEEMTNANGRTRGAFRVHFDTGHPGSAGCIALQSASAFLTFRHLMKQLHDAGTRSIQLVLNYT